MLKQAIKGVLNKVAPSVLEKRNSRLSKEHEDKVIEEWQKKGSPAPPPHIVKQRAILDYQKEYAVSAFVETGTYLGNMIEAQKANFQEIHSVELGKDLHEKALKRFENDTHVKLWLGDSGKVLPKIVATLNKSAIFWLDGHYSGGVTAQGEKDCPIYEELKAILSDSPNKHIILIDDARCFVGEGDYPTVDALKKYVSDNYTKDFSCEVNDDIIRLVLK